MRTIGRPNTLIGRDNENYCIVRGYDSQMFSQITNQSINMRGWLQPEEKSYSMLNTASIYLVYVGNQISATGLQVFKVLSQKRWLYHYQVCETIISVV